MSVPSGYRAYCQIIGLNPFHPERWTDSERDVYARWRLDVFRATWHYYHTSGHGDLIRQQHGRDALINHVKADLAEARRPMIRNPWSACPCHRRRVGMGLPQDLDRDDFPDGMPSRARLLTWLATEFGR